MNGILVIEDEPTDMTAIVQVLEQNYPQYPITQCTSAASFLEAFDGKESSFKLVITDMIIPLLTKQGKSTVTELEKLRRTHPWFANDWEGSEAGERIIAYIRKQKMSSVPILLHTNIPQRLLKDLIGDYSKLEYCEKSSIETESLSCAIKKALSL